MSTRTAIEGVPARIGDRTRMRRWAADGVWILCGAGLGMGIRSLLDPILGAHAQFVLAFAAVAIVAAMRGAVPGMLTAVLCAGWAVATWLPAPTFVGRHGAILTGLFLLSSTVVVMVINRRRTHRFGEDVVAPIRLPLRSAALLIAAGAFPLVFFGFVGWASYQDAIAAAYARLERTASIAAEHLLRVVEVNRVVARSLVHEMATDSDETLLQREPRLHNYVRNLVSGSDQIQSIWVWDVHGRPLFSSVAHPAPRSLDISDREYFRAHRDRAEDWYVSHTLRSRTTGEAFFGISARREVDGRFAGVVSVSLHPGYFSEFYRRLAQAEPGLRVGLLREDGAVIARWPDPPTANEWLQPESPLRLRMREGQVSGTFRNLSPSDGRVRHVVFQRANGYPLYLAAGLERTAILGSWYRDMSLLAIVVFPASLGLVWLLFVAFERSERMRAAYASAREEAEQRGRAEDALRHAQKLEALGLLTGGVAHDFNNLLAVVSNSVYLLRHLQNRRGAGEDEAAPVAAISRAVESGTKLTRQLLAFSRRQPLAPEVVRVQDVLTAMKELLQTIVSRRIELEVIASGELPCVRVDPAELELAVINLVINARDAIRGRGRIEISAAAVRDQGEQFVRVSVRDNGIGIAADLVERVFEPFFTTKPRGTGTGLGLSQVYGFCTQAGGGVRLESDPERGTLVSMFLPVTDQARTQAQAKEPHAPSRIDARVLFVEDNDDIGTTMQEVLRSLGADVTYVRSGDEALRALAKDANRFDIVVSDVAMPGSVNGIELAQLCRRRWPRLPVVLMTGYTAELEAAVSDGFTVLAKPIVPEALARTLSRQLATRGVARVEPS